MVMGRLPSVPEYYQEHIDAKVDLIMFPKQCCPFHTEKTPSFSYDVKTGRWSCFGKCHAHGDVVEMHKRHFHFSTREEAFEDLRVRYDVPKESYTDAINRMTKEPIISPEEVMDNVTYTKLVALANCPERWLELDYLMSKVPFDRFEAEELLYRWTG